MAGDFQSSTRSTFLIILSFLLFELEL